MRTTFVTLWVLTSAFTATRAARAQGTEAEPPTAADPDGGVLENVAGDVSDISAVETTEMPPGYEAPYVTNDDTIVNEDSFVQDQTIADSYDDGYDPQAYQEFDQTLAPYGSWIDDATYGRVWQPESAVVGTDFVPYYTNGYWTLTEFGWTWVSNWNWGWAPFHYGRWIVIAGYGWCWTPGTMWGPAWVSWRSGGGYVGWAPMPPRGVRVVSHFGPRSGWRFMAADRFGNGRRLDCVPHGQIPAIWRRTGVVSHERVLNHGTWSVRVNAGPVRMNRVAPVRLASVAPGNMPQVKILPHAGAPTGMRPWTRGPFNQPASGAPGGGGGGHRGGGHQGGGWVNRPSAQKLSGPAISGPMPSQPMRPVPHVIGGGASPYASRPTAAPPPQMGRQPQPQSSNRVLPHIDSQPMPRTLVPAQPPPTHQARQPVFHAPVPRPQVFQPSPTFQPPAPVQRAPVFQPPAPRAAAPMNVAPAQRFGGGGSSFGGGGSAPRMGGGSSPGGGGGARPGGGAWGGHRR